MMNPLVVGAIVVLVAVLGIAVAYDSKGRSGSNTTSNTASSYRFPSSSPGQVSRSSTSSSSRSSSSSGRSGALSDDDMATQMGGTLNPLSPASPLWPGYAAGTSDYDSGSHHSSGGSHHGGTDYSGSDTSSSGSDYGSSGSGSDYSGGSDYGGGSSYGGGSDFSSGGGDFGSSSF